MEYMENKMNQQIEAGINEYESMCKEIQDLKNKVRLLQDFAIWMTGCGYDFCQHEYFREQRDKLLKDMDKEVSFEVEERI